MRGILADPSRRYLVKRPQVPGATCAHIVDGDEPLCGWRRKQRQDDWVIRASYRGWLCMTCRRIEMQRAQRRAA